MTPLHIDWIFFNEDAVTDLVRQRIEDEMHDGIGVYVLTVAIDAQRFQALYVGTALRNHSMRYFR